MYPELVQTIFTYIWYSVQTYSASIKYILWCISQRASAVVASHILVGGVPLS